MKNEKRMIFILIIIFSIIPVISYFEIKKITSYRTVDSISIHKCSGYTEVVKKYDDLEKCESFDFEQLDPDGVPYDKWKDNNEEYTSLSLKDCCYAYENNIPLSPDYYSVFYNLINNTKIVSYYYIYIIGLVLFFSLYGLNKKLRSKYLVYYVQRDKYSKFIIKSVLRSYSYVIAIIFFFLIMYLLSKNISNHLDRTYLIGDSSFADIYYKDKHFLMLYCLQTCLQCMTFINVGIIFLKKNKLFISILESYIIYFVAILLITKFNLVPINILFAGRQVNIYVAIIWAIIYFIISLVFVIILYKNKEKVFKDLERNI